MARERIYTTSFASGQFIKAIESKDYEQLDELIEKYGVDTKITLRKTIVENDGGVTVMVTGTPLGICTYLQEEDLGIYLLNKGASIEPYHHDSEGWFGWNAVMMDLIEACSNTGLNRLAYALLRRPEPWNLDWYSTYNADNLECAFPCETNLQNIIGSKHFQNFFVEIGGLRGKANGIVYEIRSLGHEFRVRIDNKPAGIFENFQNALMSFASNKIIAECENA
jgi:hypothetical protein